MLNELGIVLCMMVYYLALCFIYIYVYRDHLLTKFPEIFPSVWKKNRRKWIPFLLLIILYTGFIFFYPIADLFGIFALKSLFVFWIVCLIAGFICFCFVFDFVLFCKDLLFLKKENRAIKNAKITIQNSNSLGISVFLPPIIFLFLFILFIIANILLSNFGTRNFDDSYLLIFFMMIGSGCSYLFISAHYYRYFYSVCKNVAQETS